MSDAYEPYMPLLNRIKSEGKCLDGGILKVDSFVNHQLDPLLMMDLAKEFVKRFSDKHIDKVITIESSGIAPAILVGLLLKKPVVFAKKKKPSTMNDMYETEVFSFTKNRSYSVCCSKEFISKDENILFIDDFLANGNAAKGIIDLVNLGGAKICGMGFIVEKSFQKGGTILRNLGYQVESLVIIDALDDCKITFKA